MFVGLRGAKIEHLFDPYTGSRRAGNFPAGSRQRKTGKAATIRKIRLSRIVEMTRKKPENLVNMGVSGLFVASDTVFYIGNIAQWYYLSRGRSARESAAGATFSMISACILLRLVSYNTVGSLGS